MKISEKQAENIVDAIFADLRDRRFLKWLFAEHPDRMGPILHDSHGEALMALDEQVQDEIASDWKTIILNSDE